MKPEHPESMEDLRAEVARLREELARRDVLDGSQVSACTKIVNTSIDLMTLVNRDFRYDAVSDSFCHAMGRDRADLLGRTVAEVWGSDTFENAIRGAFESCFGGQSVRYEAWFAVPALGRRCFDVMYTPARDTRGEVTHAVAVSRDITARRKAEEELERTDLKYRTLFENLPIGVCLTDPDGQIIEANASSERMLGVSRQEHYRRTIDHPSWSICRPDGSPFPSEEYPSVHALHTGEPAEAEMGICRDNGPPVWIHVNAIPMNLPGVGVLVTYADVTERVVVQRRLEESEEQYRQLFSTMSEGFALHEIICDEEGRPTDYRFLQVNPAFERLTGIQGSMVIGRTVNGVFPKIEGEWIERYGRVALTGISDHFEMYTSAMGQHYQVSAYCPAPGRFACIFRDVTEQRRSLEALKESEQRLEMALGVGRLAWWEWNIPTGNFMNSEACARLLGYPDGAHEETITWWLAGVHPDDLARANQEMNRHLEGHSTGYDLEYRIRRHDGTYAWIHTRGHVIQRDPAGNLVQLLGVSQDISEQKQSQQALEESERRFRTLFDHSPVPILTGNLSDLSFTRVNHKCCEALGYGHDELIGMTISQICHPDDLPVVAAWQEMMQMSATALLTGEMRLLVRDGSVRWASLTVAALDSGGCGAESFVCVGIDITEARRAAEERRAIEARLAQSQRMESLGVLAGGIAHDFNNILMAVIGNTDLALEDLPADSGVREFLHEALAGAQRAADLSTQMLAYSGRGQFHRKTANLAGLLGEMRPLLTASVASRHRIHVEAPKNLPDITADPSQIRQVVASLVCNASEAIGDANGDITIILGSRMHGSHELSSPYTIEDHMPGMYVTLEVTDTGCGIDTQALPRLFDPFYTTKFTGRGLGLASVLGIVKAHGGVVQVETMKGKGSTFRLLFPAAETPAAVGNGVSHSGEAAAKPLVLVVDDEEIVLLVMRRILERLGYEVLAAPDGETAISLCRDHHDRLACIVLDLSMPRMDGEVTLRGLRAIRRDIPVIVASGYAEADVIRRFPENQVQGFIQKPFSKSEFESKLTDVLDS